MTNKQYLFLMGTPRSGTTAMVDILNCHRRVLILPERYFHKARLTEDLFEKERLFTLLEGDTFYNPFGDARRARLKERYDDAMYVGEKNPRLYERLGELEDAFPKCTIIFMSRNVFDVASSYNQRAKNKADHHWPSWQDYRIAVKEWNTAHFNLMRLAEEPSEIRVIFLRYEFFFCHAENVRQLFAQLELNVSPPEIDTVTLNAILRTATELEKIRDRKLSSDEKAYICTHGNFRAYRRALRHFAA